MITIQCDNCDRPFDVRPEDRGGKVPCPYCGDVNRVPADGEANPAPRHVATARAEPVMAGARSADVGQGDAPGEKELCVVRPAMFRAHPFRYSLIVLLLLLGVAGVIAGLTIDRVGTMAVWPSLALILGTGVWFIWWFITTHYWERLVISNKRTIRHVGIIKRHTTEVLHDHVRSVDIRQTFMERMFNVGTIGIDSAGQDDIEIEARDIPRPYEVKKTIDQYRKM